MQQDLLVMAEQCLRGHRTAMLEKLSSVTRSIKQASQTSWLWQNGSWKSWVSCDIQSGIRSVQQTMGSWLLR